MSLDLHVAGPGLDVSRRLLPGEPALVLGRDADCTICLPDPQRSVSRRHLSVWNEGDLLHFHVLSVVNGVRTAEGELRPGARGVLQPGEWLQLSEYRLEVAAVPAGPAADDDDPWAEFEREAAQLLATASLPPPVRDEDPFGDWGFQSSFGPGGSTGPQAAPGADLGAFFQGLGVPGVEPGSFTPGELEAMGRLTRVALQGLLQVLQSAGGTRQAVRVEDRTTLEPPQVNPLRMDTPLESKLWYLFGGHAAAAGCIPPDKAVAEVVEQLAAHHRAMAQATQAALAGVLQEFDPEVLKEQLLPGGARLFESARAWEAYARAYAERRQDLHGWVRQLMDRHFSEAYARAARRGKQHTGEPPPG